MFICSFGNESSVGLEWRIGVCSFSIPRNEKKKRQGPLYLDLPYPYHEDLTVEHDNETGKFKVI